MRGRHAARVLLLLFQALGLVTPLAASADLLEDLRAQLFDRRERLQEVLERIEAYRTEVAERQTQAETLKKQISIIEDTVTTLKLEIDKTAIEVEEVQSEQAVVREEIRRTEEDIARKRGQIREAVRLYQVLSSDSVIESFFKYPTLSGALVEVRALERLQQRTSEALAQIKELRVQLQTRSTALRDLERELAELQERQERQKRTFEDQQAVKERLLKVTKQQEVEFQELLTEAAEEQRRANAEIGRIEADVRAELERQGIVRLGGVGIFDWPIDPIFGISCGFHCPDYPYLRILGPHTGIDLPTHMGTPVRAGADGYVARARDSGGPGYSYVLLLHGDDLSTVYGHLSSIAVETSVFVTRGQVLGATGGAPGTRGAGLSTGPHLHFEVRKDGMSVNPAGYLP